MNKYVWLLVLLAPLYASVVVCLTGCKGENDPLRLPEECRPGKGVEIDSVESMDGKLRIYTWLEADEQPLVYTSAIVYVNAEGDSRVERRSLQEIVTGAEGAPANPAIGVYVGKDCETDNTLYIINEEVKNSTARWGTNLVAICIEGDELKPVALFVKHGESKASLSAMDS